jgi:glycosyltransferase involved in cell wall biosynthesis
MTSPLEPTDAPPRVLIAIPAYNEEHTLGPVVQAVRALVPEFDVLVIDDGSDDGSAAVLRRLGIRTATHGCNLGYGRAVQTGIKYAHRNGYQALITFDADGQHRVEDISSLYAAFIAGGFDLLIGSRFVRTARYDGEPRLRRAGMWLFSMIIALLFQQRIYDTSSGFKVIGRRVFGRLMVRPSVDLHAEAIACLLEARCRVGEHPITVNARRHGQSMYTMLSAIGYPLKVSFLIVLGVIDARLPQRSPHEH